MDGSLVGFASCVRGEQPLSYMAGFLVLDASGEPQEFCVTRPLEIDMFRRLVWGDSLEPYLFSKHFLPRIVEFSKKKPDAIFVRQQLFLQARKHVSIPLLAISEAPPDSKDEDTACMIRVVDPLGSATEFYLQCAATYSYDLEVGKSVLEQLSSACFPLEPFSRIERALGFVKEKLKKRE